ncbi:hypothetical protein PC113_g23983, partial [Phytophthora cactorum]
AIRSLQNCWLFESPAHLPSLTSQDQQPGRDKPRRDSTGVTAVVNEGPLLRGECVWEDAGARETA